MKTEKVVTRFAPSPTGLLHAGNYRTAVFAYLFARQNGGKFILRIEDTDKARSTKANEDNILESLTWLGIEHDEFYRQSERSSIYREYLEKLIKEDKAYISKETPTETGGRTEVIRFRNPNKKVTFHDMIRGDITFDTTELGDFVIAKSLDEAIFHFVVVLDDYLMGITHAIRGEDHISNTPRQILIQEALGAPTPLYAHLPLVLAPDRSKLSKRKGALPMTEYRNQGYLPESLFNFMALLGWNSGTEKEIYSKEELIKDFTLEKVQKSGAIFDDVKLRWMNKEHLKRMPKEIFVEKIHTILTQETALTHATKDIVSRIYTILIERIETFTDIKTSVDSGDLTYYFTSPVYEKNLLLWKNSTGLEESKTHLLKTKELLTGLNTEFPTEEEAKSLVWNYAEEKGRGNVLWPLRIALSGKEKSPNPFALISVLGKTESLTRIDNAITQL